MLTASLLAVILAAPAPEPVWVEKLFGRIEQISAQCGPAPPPPPGCHVGACQCDANGNNCQWTFVCR